MPVTEAVRSEDDLVARARERDEFAIRALIQRHNQRLYRIARSILRDDSEAEDALQEGYCSAFSSLGSFRGEARLGSWLARIVVNAALQRRRRARQTMPLADNAAIDDFGVRIIPFPGAVFEPDPETAAAQRQIRAILERAIDALPEVFRTVLVARVIEGMSIEETAALFGIPPDTVKTRLHRARRLLKREAEKQIGPVLGGAFPFAGHRCSRMADRVLARLGIA